MAGKRKHWDEHPEEGEMQGAIGPDPYRGLIRFKARKLAGDCSGPHLQKWTRARKQAI